LRVEVTVRGRMAHGAMPETGVNPVTLAARFVVAVEEFENKEVERHDEDPFLGYPSLTPTILMGPDCGEPHINVIPASAYVALDIRTIPGQSHEVIVRRLRECLLGLESEDHDFDASLEVIEERRCTATQIDAPLVRSMAAAYTELTAEEPRFNGVPGATDGTYLSTLVGIPIVTTGQGTERFHTTQTSG
jgi:succinyl-diaminopimelate desuccinylase